MRDSDDSGRAEDLPALRIHNRGDGMQQPGPARADPINEPGEVSDRYFTQSSQSAFHDHNFELNQAIAATGGAPDKEGETEILRIATRLSQRRSVPLPGENVGDYDPAMDPDRAEFDLHAWLRHFIHQIRELGFTESRTGVAFRQLDVFGSGAAVQVQQTVGSLLLAPFRIGESLTLGEKKPKHILHGFNGLIKSGELLVVLGRPGSGCSTLLKSLCGELHGLQLGNQSTVHYGGVPQKQMQKEFRGEAIYNQEVDKHFPHLTVGQTLEFAASCRTPAHRIRDMPRDEYCRYLARVVMAIFGLHNTYNTKVGNDFVRGVSGGERKRVSIAEMVLAGSLFGAWDNSTRGLDSASALTFVEALRKSCDLGSLANAVAIYQASQSIYDLFDKATVLYEGRQIYFGPASLAKDYFERQGWHCPPRQTTGDFLTSVTNPMERRARDGMEAKVPRTSEDFERYWRESREFKNLMRELDEYDSEVCGEHQEKSVAHLRQQKNFRQANHVRPKSPYTISVWMQIRLNCKRAYQRTWNDLSATVAATLIQVIMALIIGSSFFKTPDTTEGFYAKGSTLFVAVLLNALIAMLEIASLYSQRPIVEKHASYAFYHPFTEAAAGLVSIIPIKFVIAAIFNTALYFLAGLKREAGAYFLYFLVTYVAMFAMTAVFRTMAAITKTVSQALALSGVLVLALVMYTGFVIPVPEMHPWFGWIRWINPIYYAFEILVANEFHNREFPCASRELVPAYQPLVGDSWICGVTGAVAGKLTVSGDAFIAQNYHYYHSHVWRNFGILMAFMVVFIIIYLVATELNSASHAEAESLVFRRGHVPRHLLHGDNAQPALTEGNSPGEVTDVEGGDHHHRSMEPQRDVFAWRNVVYDIQIKEGERRLLDHVDGWVKPGTLTALMGVSGAGKTTLLDVLAMRTTMGVISGNMLVNGKPRDPSFQRKTGYVQQQDLHVDTATVRESLQFSAMLRQPASVSREEKYAFVEEVIRMLSMEEFANAVVGVPGQGLNVEQRKLLTIGVELAAKPKLLVFLDEPTSGLDSQSSWAIVTFLRKLADSGQAILCTVHQPSAILFQQFDRLLFLARGGKTVYFGDIGDNSGTLIDYFESNGARKCGDMENPAEYMIEVVNEGTNDQGKDWQSVWKNSPEFQATQVELDKLGAVRHQVSEKPIGTQPQSEGQGSASGSEFAMPLSVQIDEVTRRLFRQYWRMPQYIVAKVMLGVTAGLFIGFTFWKADATLAGMQNFIYSVFMVTTIFSTVVQQIQPHFLAQRELYEVRERPSKTYSWLAFILANLVVEIPYQIVTSVVTYATFYLPIMGVHQGSLRQGLIFLLVMQLLIYGSAFAHMTVVVMPDLETAGSIVTFFTVLSILFSGVLQTPAQLPGFWRNFVYRVSPFNYWVSAIVSTALHDRPVACSQRETSIFDPPANQTCGEYLAPYLQLAPGQLLNPEDVSGCQYCTFTVADQFLSGSQIAWSDKWRNYGIVWAYIAFDLMVAVLLYYMFRVKQWRRK